MAAESFAEGVLVQVTLVEDAEYETEDGASISVPAGTRLMGYWQGVDQEDGAYLVELGRDDLWEFAPSQIRVEPVEDAQADERERVELQRKFAEDSFLRARQIVEHNHLDVAEKVYAQAFAELRPVANDREIASVRVDTAIFLCDRGDYPEAVPHLRAAADLMEALIARARDEGGPWGPTAYIDFAEQTVPALIILGNLHRRLGDTAAAVATARRLVRLGKLIKKRYVPKTELLVHAARILVDAGNEEEAAPLIDQAERFYHQQLARLADPRWDEGRRICKLRKYLDQLQGELVKHLPARKVQVQIVADTPADFAAVAAYLRKVCGEDLAVGVARIERVSQDHRAGERTVGSLTFTFPRSDALPKVTRSEGDWRGTDAYAVYDEVWREGGFGWVFDCLRRAFLVGYIEGTCAELEAIVEGRLKVRGIGVKRRQYLREALELVGDIGFSLS